MRKLLCKLGFHYWIDISQPVTGRRNLSRRLEDGTILLDSGPVETFYPGEGIIPFRRECAHCHIQQIQFYGRWV